jgi:pyrimidine operon attenuation protein/uracil phosphoribosyltransferase
MVQIMDESLISRSLARITHEIIERNNNIDEICILGIKNRGVKIAKTLADNINKFVNKSVPFGVLDVTMFRDDYSIEYKKERATENVFPCDLHNKIVIICDDVLYTGRTARAAIEAVLKAGRPQSIQLAVLVDRGHRELPIRADYVGKNIPTSISEVVAVKFKEVDGENVVKLYEK